MFFDVLGIDIGAESMKLALVSNKRVRKAAEIFYPEDYFRDGWITSTTRMGMLLRNALRDEGFRVRRAAIQLAGDLSYVHTASMPIMNAKQLDLNLRFAFADYINENLDNYSFDYSMLTTPKEIKALLAAPPSEDGEEKTMDFLAVAAPTSLLAQCREITDRAKLFLDRAAPPECSCIALVRAAIEDMDEDPDKEFCIIDLGNRAIRLYMLRGERHVVTRVLETGMKTMDIPVSNAFHVKPDDAHQLYRINHDNCHALDACVSIYNDIALELMRTVNFYKFSHQDSTVSDIWLIGGGAAVAPLARVLENTLEMKVHPASELIPGAENIANSCYFAQAVGAALC